jgi:hypothetical protein
LLQAIRDRGQFTGEKRGVDAAGGEEVLRELYAGRVFGERADCGEGDARGATGGGALVGQVAEAFERFGKADGPERVGFGAIFFRRAREVGECRLVGGGKAQNLYFALAARARSPA